MVARKSYGAFESHSLRQPSFQTPLQPPQALGESAMLRQFRSGRVHLDRSKLDRKVSPAAFFSRALYFWAKIRFTQTHKAVVVSLRCPEPHFEKHSLGQPAGQTGAPASQSSLCITWCDLDRDVR